MRRALSPVPIAAICVLVALLALLAYGLAQNEPDRSVDDALAAGERERAPELELPKLDGSGDGALADYRGQVVVLNFWASWCKPCKDESPLLETWHKRMRGRGGTVLGVDMLDVTSRAEEFIDEYDLTYPMLKDKDGERARALRRRPVPRDVRDRPPGPDRRRPARPRRRGLHADRRWSRSCEARGAGARARTAGAPRGRRRPGLPADDARRHRGRGDVPGLRHAARPRERGAAGPGRARLHPGADRRLQVEGRGQAGARRGVRRERAGAARATRATTTSATCSST